MRFSSGFLRFTAVCALLSALTTLGVHLLPMLQAPVRTVEEAAALHSDPLYRARLWIVVFHILIVFCAAWGLAARQLSRAAGWAGLGLFGYGVFALGELVRTSLALFAVNAWRASFLSAETPAASRAMLRTLLEGWFGVGTALFGLFSIGFIFGNLFFGLGAAGGRGLERAVGVVLLVWAGIGAVGLAALAAGTPEPPSWIAWTFQPAARALLGIWMWRTARPTT